MNKAPLEDSRPPPPPPDRDPMPLPDLAALYPACFDEVNPRPLKRRIDKDLVERHWPAVVLPTGAHKAQRNALRRRLRLGFKQVLADYCARPAYLRQMIAGAPRIDLDGQPDGAVTAEEAEVAAQMLRGERPPRRPPTDTCTSAPDRPKDAPLTEENIVPGRLELTVKFSQLPKPLPVKAGIKIGVQTESALVVTTLPLKAWKKLTKAAEEWPAWVASVTGKLSAQAGADKGAVVILEQPAVQVFEKKPRPLAEPQP